MSNDSTDHGQRAPEQPVVSEEQLDLLNVMLVSSVIQFTPALKRVSTRPTSAPERFWQYYTSLTDPGIEDLARSYDVESSLRLAEWYVEMGYFRMAESMLASLLRDHPQCADAHWLLTRMQDDPSGLIARPEGYRQPLDRYYRASVGGRQIPIRARRFTVDRRTVILLSVEEERGAKTRGSAPWLSSLLRDEANPFDASWYLLSYEPVVGSRLHRLELISVGGAVAMNQEIAAFQTFEELTGYRLCWSPPFEHRPLL